MKISTKKLIISILLGLVGYAGSYYSLNFSNPPLSISIEWCDAMPLLAGMAFGGRYAFIAAILGLGAFYPFALYANNGWGNAVTSILLVLSYSAVGYFTHLRQRNPMIWNHPLVIYPLVGLIYSLLFRVLFPIALSFNPPFWSPTAVLSIPDPVLDGIFTKSFIILIVLILFDDYLLKLSFIRSCFGLEIRRESRYNEWIALGVFLVSILLWCVFILFSSIFIDQTFPQRLFQSNDPHETIALIVFFAASIFIGSLTIQFMESRLKAEDELAKSRESYRLIFEQAADGIFISDATGHLVDVNESGCNLVGYTRDEILHLNMHDLIMPEEETNVLAHGNLIKAGDTSILERRIRHKNSSLICVEISARKLGDGRIQGLVRDISARKQAEEALRESEKQHRLLIENNHDIIYTLTAEGIFTYVSPAWTVLLGHPVSQVVGRSFQEFVHVDDLAGCFAWLQKVIETGTRQEGIEYRVRHMDGSWYWHTSSAVPIKDETGTSIGFEGTARDITERKRTEEALRQETIFNEAIFNSVPGVLYLYDEQGYLLRWNKKHEEMTGYSNQELDHFYLLDWYKNEPEDIDRITKGVQKALEEGFASTEATLITKNGSKILFDFTAARLDIGDKVYITGIGIDITDRRKVEKQVQADQIELQRLFAETERSRLMLLSVVEDQKEAEEQIKRLNTELEQRVTERTAQLTAANQELEAFAYSVSHDLRAPLRSLDGFSSILKEDYAGQLDEKGKQYLSHIQEASKRMDLLIRDLLNLSRVTQAEFICHKVDLSALAREIATELQTQDSNRSPVNWDITSNLVIEGDAALIKIAMENLLNNAYKFTGQRVKAIITFGMTEQSGENVYFVRDNGTGFSMEHANKLFTPFQRLHSAKEFPGTGIGLSIVQRIINRHGGRIWPESEIGQGTTFYFTFGQNTEGNPG